jgi:hypothetical protein
VGKNIYNNSSHIGIAIMNRMVRWNLRYCGFKQWRQIDQISQPMHRDVGGAINRNIDKQSNIR